MFRNLFIKSLLLLFLISGSLTLLAQTKIDTARIDSLLNYFYKNNKMMGSIALAKNNKIQFSRAYGYAQINGNTKLTADINTKYRIGSISKMFTSVIIFQLIEEKKLSLNTLLSVFFPKIPNAGKITISDLLEHHSGLHNFTNDPDYLTWYTKPKSEKEILDIFEHDKPDFQPGEKGEYSNTNYVLLGYIIEKITHDSYSNELQKRILKKLHLMNTYYGHKTEINNNEAYSYTWKDSTWTQEPETDMSIPGGAGAIVSNPEDLIKFIYALFRGKLITEESLKEMTTLKDNFGMGIFKFPFYERQAFGHTGGIDGFESFVSYFPDDSTAFAFCGNGMNYTMNDILLDILSSYYNKPYNLPDFKSIKLSLKELSRFEGIYSSETLPLLITIKLNGSTLTAQATNQSAFPLTAVSETEFKYDQAGIVITFDKSKNGQFDKFTLKQGGAAYLYSRQK